MGAARVKLVLNALKQLRLDHRRDFDNYDFFRGLAFTGAGRSLIEFPLTDIDGVGQYLVQRTDPKGLAAAGPVAIPVKPI
jgi:hypothetical protein